MINFLIYFSFILILQNLGVFLLASDQSIVKQLSTVSKLIASVNAITLFWFCNVSLYNLFFNIQNNVNQVGEFLIYTQLSYYITDTVYSLFLGNTQAIVHHGIGMFAAGMSILYPKYSDLYLFNIVGGQGSTIFVRLFDLQRLFYKKYNAYEQILVRVNFLLYNCMNITLSYPSLYLVIYKAYELNYNSVIAIVISQLVYNVYWDLKLIKSYRSYFKKIETNYN